MNPSRLEKQNSLEGKRKQKLASKLPFSSDSPDFWRGNEKGLSSHKSKLDVLTAEGARGAGEAQGSPTSRDAPPTFN